jgi:hypothetical protein
MDFFLSRGNLDVYLLNSTAYCCDISYRTFNTFPRTFSPMVMIALSWKGFFLAHLSFRKSFREILYFLIKF